ncbi:hypothetical protein JGH11_04600 [Dysgonomonas sp. Marseille-P4677]|uniref:hypothetical protein n=1 Tax=Dysgonomonas sp. Marseille-P4677 TaxID=2364790 RepID=UPI001914D99E|nr:hypothetical protein [Dysgonomonas sp. Marseille-P4677]MBK5720147.1 hypothetical protein [Dysgonomonas sp. Marseille-P4677]
MKVLVNNYEPLDLAPDFELNIQITNPLLTDQGSMSLPMSLPASPQNLKNLGFPNRIDRSYKLRKKTPVTIEASVMQKRAILEILSYNKDDGIESVILLNEAQMYTKMQEVSMTAAFQIKREAASFSIPNQTISDPMDRMIKYMELVMLGQIADPDFYLFPVGTDNYKHTYETRSEQFEVTVYNLLNEKMTWSQGSNFDDMQDIDLNGNKYAVFRGRRPFKVKNGGEEYDVPKGYGITPFLKENFILHQIFNYFGYELRTSIFDTDPDLCRMVLINNTADALVKGVVDYSQLVPTCTIHEYLETVRQRFGCEFFVSEDLKFVIPVFWKDVLNSNPRRNYTDKVAGEPTIDYVTPKQLKLCYKREIDFTESSVDTYQKFERDYGKIIRSMNDLPGRGWKEEDYDLGFYLIRKYCAIYECYEYWSSNQNKNVRSFRYVTKALFDYYLEGEDTEYEEPTSGMQCVPFMYGAVLYSGGGGVYSSDYGPNLPFLYIGERRHMNTSLKIIVTSESGSESITHKEEDPGSCSLMAALYTKGIGTMHRFDIDGNIVGELDLTFGGENGLYQRFWKDYDDVLKHSFNKLTYDLNFTVLDIINFRMDELVFIDGQYLLPEQLEYTIKEDGVRINKVEFRTVRLYWDPLDIKT